jgi:hypothetical protein
MIRAAAKGAVGTKRAEWAERNKTFGTNGAEWAPRIRREVERA